MPAEAGIQVHSRFNFKNTWIPACAEITEARADFQSLIAEFLAWELKIVSSALLS
jgi:hypothetical protein